jgi:hypothetical protein
MIQNILLSRRQGVNLLWPDLFWRKLLETKCGD